MTNTTESKNKTWLAALPQSGVTPKSGNITTVPTAGWRPAEVTLS